MSACRICGRAIGADERTVADAQLALDGSTGRLHPACETVDELSRLRAELAAARAREGAAVELAKRAGVKASTLRSAMWRAERSATPDATPRATPDATPAAAAAERKPAAAATPVATPDATLDATGGAAHYLNARGRGRVEVPQQAETKNEKQGARPPRAAPRIPAREFRRICATWGAAYKRMTGESYGRVEGRDQRIVVELCQLAGGTLEACALVDAFARAWKAEGAPRPWFLRDETAPRLPTLRRHAADVLRGPWQPAPAPLPTWKAAGFVSPQAYDAHLEHLAAQLAADEQLARERAAAAAAAAGDDDKPTALPAVRSLVDGVVRRLTA